MEVWQIILIVVAILAAIAIFQAVCIRFPLFTDLVWLGCSLAVGIISMVMPSDFNWNDTGHLTIYIVRVGLLLLAVLGGYADSRVPKYIGSDDEYDYYKHRGFFSSIFVSIFLTGVLVGLVDFLFGFVILKLIEGFAFKWLGFIAFLLAAVALFNCIKRIARR